jgi:hypothetical protein
MPNIRMHLTPQSVALGSLRAYGTPSAGDAARSTHEKTEGGRMIGCPGSIRTE